MNTDFIEAAMVAMNSAKYYFDYDNNGRGERNIRLAIASALIAIAQSLKSIDASLQEGNGRNDHP